MIVSDKKKISQLEQRNASLEFLSDMKFEIFEYMIEVTDNFEGTDYEQGKKDGLRIALGFLGYDMGSLISDGNNSHPRTNEINELESEIKKLNGIIDHQRDGIQDVLNENILLNRTIVSYQNRTQRLEKLLEDLGYFVT